MDKLILNEKEIKFLKHQFKMPKYCIVLLVSVLVFTLFFFIYSKYFFQPGLESLVSSLTDSDEVLKDMIFTFMNLSSGFYSVVAFIFPLWFICFLAGLVYSQSKLNSILKKALPDELTSHNQSLEADD